MRAGFPLTVSVVLVTMGMQAASNGMAYWLAYWVAHESSFSAKQFVIISSVIVAVNIVFALLRSFLFAWGGLRAARKLYVELVK